VIRRTALVAAAAVALILAPTAAMAYEDEQFAAAVSDATPAAGSPFTVSVTGPANTPVTLTVSGAAQIDGVTGSSLTKNTNAQGVAQFSVVLANAGSYTITATDASGAVITTQTVSVAAVGVAASRSSASGRAATGAQLGDTGFDGMGLAAGAGALVIAGAGAVVVARRRQSPVAGA